MKSNVILSRMTTFKWLDILQTQHFQQYTYVSTAIAFDGAVMMMMIFRNLHLCILMLHLFILCCDVCPRFHLFNRNNWIEWANLATILEHTIIKAVFYMYSTCIQIYLSDSIVCLLNICMRARQQQQQTVTAYIM